MAAAAAAAAGPISAADRFRQIYLTAEQMEEEDCRNTGRDPKVTSRTFKMLCLKWRIETDDSLQPSDSYLRTVYFLAYTGVLEAISVLKSEASLNSFPATSGQADIAAHLSYEALVSLAAKAGIILPLPQPTLEAIARQRADVNEAGTRTPEELARARAHAACALHAIARQRADVNEAETRTPEELARARAYAALTAEANAAAAKVCCHIAERYRESNEPHEQEILAHAREIAQNAEAIATRLETERGAPAAAPIPLAGARCVVQ